MSKRLKEEVGPIYGVPLLSVIPIPGSSMKQALPSRNELDTARTLPQGDRLVAGYEVLLAYYHESQKSKEWCPSCGVSGAKPIDGGDGGYEKCKHGEER